MVRAHEAGWCAGEVAGRGGGEVAGRVTVR